VLKARRKEQGEAVFTGRVSAQPVRVVHGRAGKGSVGCCGNEMSNVYGWACESMCIPGSIKC
jgi:hypothetical protein